MLNYVSDPESAIKEIKARVYGMGGGAKDTSGRLFDEHGKALYPTTPLTQIDAETLMLRLKAFVAQDSRTIQETARQYGTRGEPREFYSLLTSPDRPLSNREIKQPILKLCEERFPLSPFIGYIHRDTDDAHAHGWLSALQINGLKLHVGKEKVDGRWVDRFKQLDKISRAKDSVIHKDRERAVEKCVEMAMLSRAEQDKRLSHLVNQSGRLSLEQVSNLHRTQYALLAVAAVRSGATPDWAGIDKQVAGMPKPKGLEKLDSEWLARTWGVGRLVEQEKLGQRGAPTSVIRPMIPDRSPARPSHDPTRDRNNRPGGGSGRSRGGR